MVVLVIVLGFFKYLFVLLVLMMCLLKVTKWAYREQSLGVWGYKKAETVTESEPGRAILGNKQTVSSCKGSVWKVCLISYPLVLAVGKAFAAATIIIFGSATLVFGTAASKLDMRNVRLHMFLCSYLNYLDSHF